MFQKFTRRVLEPPAFGLDISDLTIKFTHLRRRGSGFVLDYFGEVSLPEGVVVSGEVRKEGDLVAVLKDGLRTAEGRRVATRFCIASLPEEKSFVRLIELPALKVEDIAHAVRWEVEGVIPLRFEEIYYDYALMPAMSEASTHRDVLITAFPRNVVDSYHRAITRAGFLPLALELESQAVSRAIVPKDFYSTPFIIVDIGAARTSFIIFVSGSVIFTKTVAIGGRDLEAAIVSALGVAVEEARKIKIEVGLNKSYAGGKVFEALMSQVQALASELQQQLWFYLEHPAKRHESLPDIERVLLCGGDANLIGLEKYIATTIKKLTTVADPFVNFHLPPGTIPSLPKNQSLKYSTAIGLALGAHNF